MAITLNGTTGIVSPKVNALDLELDGKNVVERGSNANGEYVRFADGTQICTFAGADQNVNTASGNMFISDALATWTYPAAFSDTPTAAGQPESASNRVTTFLSSTSTSIGYRQMGASSSTALVRTRLQAIGRWY